MPGPVVLIHRGESKVTLVETEQERFLDASGTFTGRRSPARKGQVQAMMNAVQNTLWDLTAQLTRPDGSKFDLTGFTTIRISVFATTPLQQSLTVVAGTPLGALIDGLVKFMGPAVNFEGFAEGEVEVVKSGRTHPFDRVSFKFDRRRST